ncbi:hypothetical protein GCM10027036_30940 [Flavihumibacter cheonanensis]|jgi:hypothetical protein|uniref:heavy-metal-associated domain-containing protein n=1 Tax=Flavihumibacter cheonanensis TaxID=1442385 RepID=UPI001EF95C75|nr:heavy metal transport/detoxification protein [Flavihumibacter cheonanensis]MCG7752881.1 heavy metal transport/detoxification protein [Flavihumibacter cheonanensis]
METLKFKTTIKCSGCIEKATPFLNEAVGEDNWEVDVTDTRKVLTIVNEKNIAKEDVIKAVYDAGYKAESLS